jgi:hypothetical protein
MLGKPLTRKSIVFWLVLYAIGWFAWGTVAPEAAWSRAWKPTPTALAQDYSLLSDSRNNHDIKMIFWLSPPMVPDGPARAMLDRYVIVGVARGHISPVGSMSFDVTDTLQASDSGGTPLRLLTGDDIPPALNGALTTITSVFSQSLGPFGKGFHWFVFDAGAVRACGDGGLSIPFADEVYTYQTPIPGCPGK